MKLFRRVQKESKPVTQEDRVLHELRKAGKRGVMNYEWPPMRILRAGAVVHELRQAGHNIITDRLTLPNGRSTNVWRYILQEEE